MFFYSGLNFGVQGSTARTANGAEDALARSFGGQLRKPFQSDSDSDLPTETPRRLTAFAPFDLWLTDL